METFQEFIDVGAWLGSHQAFATIATQCTAVQAQCLRKARESGVFEKLGLTWDEFCKQYAGIGRSRADDLIRRHERFGDTFFRLSDLARVSPETFSQLSGAGHIQGDVLEFDGEKLALIPENAPRIRAAVQRLRAQLSQANAAPRSAGIIALQAQLDNYVRVLDQLAAVHLDPDDLAALKGLANYAIDKFRALARTLDSKTA